MSATLQAGDPFTAAYVTSIIRNRPRETGIEEINNILNYFEEKYGLIWKQRDRDVQWDYALKFLDGLEEFEKMYKNPQTQVLVTSFLYLYFWNTGKPFGFSKEFLPQFVADSDELSEDYYEWIVVEYNAGGDFLRNPEKDVETRANNLSIDLDNLTKFVESTLPLLNEYLGIG